MRGIAVWTDDLSGDSDVSAFGDRDGRWEIVGGNALDESVI